MIPALALSALLTWSAQVFVLVAAGGLASLVLSHPKVRLYFWQGLLLLMVLLPALEPWKEAALKVVPLAPGGTVSTSIESGSAAISGINWSGEDWLWVIAAGALLRLVWIGTGFLRLRRYRKQAVTLADPPVPFTLRSVRWYVSRTIPGPVTYGWLRPSVLLPSRVLDLPSSLREAVAWHELVHVRRRDWLFVLGEELIRSLLWFHPAVWYALSRIQLAREQVADREAVRMSQDRDGYLDALVAVAAQKLRPDLAPAPLFLRKRHLAARVAAILKEVSLSRSRIAASSAAVFSAVLLAARLAIWFFPFEAPAQTVMDDPGITVDAGATLLHRSAVHYPRESHPAGTVVVEANLNPKGEVSDARVLSGPDDLRNPALASVLQWHYSPGPTRVQASIRFESPVLAPPAPPLPPPGRKSASTRSTPEAPPELSGAVKSLDFSGISQEAEQELRSRIQIREGDAVTQADLKRAAGIVKAFDEHLIFSSVWSGQAQREVRVHIGAPAQANGSMPLPGPAGPPRVTQIIPQPGNTKGADGEQILHVGGAVGSPAVVKRVNPVYPPTAKQARIQGSVKLSAVVGPDGTVKDIQVISGHPLLVPAAIESVSQWEFQPVLLNGKPVSVQTVITINFTLAE